jgi:hypothetical protein
MSYVIVRKSPATGRVMFLTESRSAGVSFEAPGNSVTGVGVSNLKTWKTPSGPYRWLKERPDMMRAYGAVGMVLEVVEQS